MKKFKLLGVVAILATLAGSLASCGGGETELVDVKIGLHTNYGAGAGYSAINQGFFEDEGIHAIPEMGAGPALAASVVAGNIDISFMGNGVAWNYFTEKREITLVALDNLTNDDKLIASKEGKGANLTAESPVTDLAAALRGAKVVLDFDATPYAFWGSLVNKINSQLPDSGKLWYTDLKGTQLPAGLSTYADANKVNLSNATNANVAAAMQKHEYDFCVAFAPVSTTLINNTDEFTMVASTLTHMPDTYTPSTWAVNTAWLNNNKETFAKVMRGLVKGMNFRRDNQQKCAEDIEDITTGQFVAATAATDIAYWLGAEEQLEILNNGDAMKYVDNIRASQQGKENVSESVTSAQAVDFSYLKTACEALKK